MTLGPVSADCRERLIGHYGPAVEHWLGVVPALLQDAATRWGMRLIAYHNAGHASVIAVGTDAADQKLLLKAWFDRSRYAYEIAALRTWPKKLAPEIRYTADDLAVAGLELIGGRPGGAPRPAHHPEAVARGIAALHAAGSASDGFPQLRDYLSAALLPRATWRFRRLGGDISSRYVDRASGLLAALSDHDVLLHADLYRENIPFRSGGRPVFTDPLPMVGDPAFDWAFWVVYYDLTQDPLARLRLASSYGGIPRSALVPWCVAVCLDGLLFYRDVGDPRAARMREVFTALAGFDQGPA